MDSSILVPLLPVAFMFLFVLMYFILYANFVQKLCSGKWYCGLRPRNLFSGSRQQRRGFLSRSDHPDFDETYIQLKGQITRIALAEAEAFRLAKILSGDSEHDAKEYIANLRMTMFPFGMSNINVAEEQSTASQLSPNEETPPPKYDDCV